MIKKMDPIGSRSLGKNEGSIRSKTNEKGVQLDRKLIQNAKH